MRPRQITPLRKVKEEVMTSVAEATQTVATEYNGWSNRETWVVNLWLSGEPSSYSVLVEAVSMQCPAVDKADWLKERLEWQLDDEIEEACIWRDLLQHAFRQVDWLEIIKANLD